MSNEEVNNNNANVDDSGLEKEKIELLDYNFLKVIGKGSYGIVKLCQNTKSKTCYAMKIMKKNDLLPAKELEHITNEYKVLCAISHPFITELKGIFTQDPSNLYFLLEYAPGGELYTLMKESKKLPLEQAKFYIAQLITVFDYLHSKTIIYRDLKPENILIDSTGYLKLTDFGFAKMIKNNLTFTVCGTPDYMSPEMIKKNGHGKSVDFWALGILLYEMLVGKTPFNDPDPMKTYQKITKSKVSYPKELNIHAKSLIKHLLKSNVKKRYGCKENGIMDFIEHKFFKDFDWKGLLFRTLTPDFVPDIKSPTDTTYFKKFFGIDENEDSVPLNKDKDPFLNW